MNAYAFFVKTLCLGTLMVKYKRDGKRCVPEIIQLDKIPHGWKIDDDIKPHDGTTILDFYQEGLKKKRYFAGKRTMENVKKNLLGSKKC